MGRATKFQKRISEKKAVGFARNLYYIAYNKEGAAMIAFRTDAQLEERLSYAAKKENKTKTEVIREALESYLDAVSSASKPKIRAGQSLAEALKADIGIWDGPENASVDTGKQLGDIFVEKHRTRRM